MTAALQRRHIDISAHLTPDELALLAENKADDAAERLRAHLAHCKSCFQAYQDAVEFRARALAGEEPHAPPELVKNGRKVPLRRGKKRGVTRAPRERMILATAGGLAALAAVWIFLGPGGKEQSSLSSTEVAWAQNSIDIASDRGPIVFPGASGGTSEPITRSGDLGSSSEVDSVLAKLKALVEEGKANTEDFFWLVSTELATGDLEGARLHLQSPQAPVDTDPRFRKLRAILAFRESRLTDAVEDLRAALTKNSNDAEATLLLGIVLLQKDGQTPEALELLKRAQARGSRQIAQRAGNILDSLEQTK